MEDQNIIKFRVRKRSNPKEFIYSLDLTNGGLSYWHDFIDKINRDFRSFGINDDNIINDEPIKALRFIGIKDKNKVDIYEGDTIFFSRGNKKFGPNNFRAKVSFEQGGFGYKIIEGDYPTIFMPFTAYDEIDVDFVPFVEVV